MKHFVVLSLALIGFGCAPRVAPQYRLLPSVLVSAPIAEAQPVAPTGDRAFDVFLADVAAAIDRHDWRGVASWFHADTYQEQVNLVASNGQPFERAAAQVVAETLGLSALVSYSGAADTAPFADLDRIQVVTLRSADAPDGSGFRAVRGDIRLEDGRTVPFTFSVRPDGTGFTIVVPQG